ncbi:MAG TPA: C4-type zinc ribbon domain-containing protein [Acidimicrobiales bacterium]|nr:C4-type zinc ribbon domain-containing protein [Acidimicrobiales bacterium]
MSSLEDLLAVQGLDTALDQLRHKRANLAERSELKDVEAKRKVLEGELATAIATRDVVAARQANLEKDIAASEARIAEIDKRMYSGEVSSSRDLQAMANEIAQIKSRVSTLEDHALEAMDEREPLDAAVDELAARDAGFVELAAQLWAAIAAAESEIDAEIAVEEGQRSSAASAVAGELLGEYERLRGRLGGIGAARLEHGTCMGCRMKLPATELDRIKHQPPDALVHCDQCGRILVRNEP